MAKNTVHTDPRYPEAVRTLSALGLGFFVTRERVDYDVSTGEGWACLSVDRVGPPALMHAWTPSPITNRLVAGNQTHFVEWVERLAAFVAGDDALAKAAWRLASPPPPRSINP